MRLKMDEIMGDEKWLSTPACHKLQTIFFSLFRRVGATTSTHPHIHPPICPAVSVSLTTGLNNTLESNKLFSGQATKTNTSISGKFNNFAGLILPIKNM